jgi:hypothetical protein
MSINKGVQVVFVALVNFGFDGNITTNFERHSAAATQERDRMSTFDMMIFSCRDALFGLAILLAAWMAPPSGSLRPAVIRRPVRRGQR